MVLRALGWRAGSGRCWGGTRRRRAEPLEQRSLLAANQFAVIGDYGDDSPNEAAVAALVKSWEPAYVVTVGDNYYDFGQIDRQVGKYYGEFIGNYQGAYGPGSATNQFFPALGNHDWDDNNAQPYLSYFTLPGNERYYDFVQGPVHFFIVDSDSREPDGTSSTSRQAQWLQAGLAASTSTFNLVVFHHPAYSSTASTTRMRWPFQQWGADAVLAGHVHNYERIVVDGLTYFVNGVGGESLRQGSPTLPGSQAFFDDAYGAMRVTVDPAGLTFDFFSVQSGGTLIDRYVLGTPAPPAPQWMVADANVVEGAASGNAQALFTVALSPAAASTATIAYSTVAGSAMAGSDFEPVSGTLTFAPGQGPQVVTVPILGDTDAEPAETFQLVLSDPSTGELGDAVAVGTIVDDDGPTGTIEGVYLSLTSGGTLTNSDQSTTSFSDADILRLAIGAAGFSYTIHFDASDVGLAASSEDVDAFDLLPDGSILVSTTGSFSVSSQYASPEAGSGATLTGHGEDLLRFTPTSLGETTTGTWSLAFDGSVQGLSGSSARIDAVAQLDDGRLLISPAGDTTIAGLPVTRHDLLAFTPGSNQWAPYFDGSSVGLTTSDENVNALDVVASGSGGLPLLYLSTKGKFSVASVAGANDDVAAFVPTALGAVTNGAYLADLVLDGSDYGLSPFNVDGIHVQAAAPSPLAVAPPEPRLSPAAVDAALAGAGPFREPQPTRLLTAAKRRPK
jgi:hypothetical protein